MPSALRHSSRCFFERVGYDTITDPNSPFLGLDIYSLEAWAPALHRDSCWRISVGWGTGTGWGEMDASATVLRSLETEVRMISVTHLEGC